MNDSPRLRRPDRHQIVYEMVSLDELLPPDHRARVVWAFVERQDLSKLEDMIKSRGDQAGAPAIAPRLLLALWLFACLDNVGSARKIARLCEEHIAYRWLCGRVGVNYHTLSDFRAKAGDFLDTLLSEMIASLVKAGVIDGTVIFQDGTKVRASAGTRSFRRESTLKRLHADAVAHVKKVMAQADDAAENVRARAAAERSAREQVERLDAAMVAMEEIKIVKERAVRKKGAKNVAEPRASTTDPEARIMKVPGGGAQPAYNVQFATDAKSRGVVGVQVVNYGVDNGLSEGMRPEVERRTGVTVQTHVTDAGYLRKETLEREIAAGVERVVPLPTRSDGTPATAHQARDSEAVRQWRDAMQAERAKSLMHQRPSVAETPNAELKTYRAMDRLLVRGLRKATNVALMSAIVYNLVHFAEALTGGEMSGP